MFLNDDRQPTELERAIAHYCEAIEQDAARELAEEQELLASRPLWQGRCRCGFVCTSRMCASCPRCGNREVST